MGNQPIQTAAVLGSGVMGSGIAALLAGAGVKTYLLDIVPKDAGPKDRNRIATENLKAALKAKPAPFYSSSDAALVIPGNFEDDLAKLADCDWVIEVVVENLEIKRSLIAKVATAVGPNTIVTSNTSGIDIDAIVEGLPVEFAARWFGTHFFNPPRYMKLLEIIPGKHTAAHNLARIEAFGRDKLGKGIVWAKNTPNFIANRIGVYGMLKTLHTMEAEGLSIPEVDLLFGKAAARPKTGVFKTADLVGIDTMVHVAKNTYAAVTDDPQRDVFLLPDFVQKLVDAGRLGNKTKGGFYTKDDSGRKVLDWKSGEYVDLDKPSFPCVDAAKKVDDPAERVATLLKGRDKGARFAFTVTAHTLCYTASLIPQIADSIVEVDRAMRWGYNWELGPFEIWDAIGVAASVKRMDKLGIAVPQNVRDMLAKGGKRFYKRSKKGLFAWDLVAGKYVAVAEDSKNIRLPLVKDAGGLIERNSGASLLDLGDGVLGVEFHTKMNAIDADIIGMLLKAVDKAEDEGWNGVVIGNHGDAFSAGANLLLVFMQAQQQAWDALEQMTREFQNANMRLKYSRVPVVAAVKGLALGGGCEIPMHCDRVVLAGDTFMGLVEVGVGLIPGAGGCKESIVKLQAGLPYGVPVNLMPLTEKAFVNIATAKVSTSGKEVIENGHVNPWQGRVVLNADHVIYTAKQEVLSLAVAGYEPPRRVPVKLGGGGVYGALLVGADGFARSGLASEYDLHIAKKLAKVLTGGNVPEGMEVDEQFLLDLEREAFLSLCGEEKTQQRIQHMLMHNKPLRN